MELLEGVYRAISSSSGQGLRDALQRQPESSPAGRAPRDSPVADVVAHLATLNAARFRAEANAAMIPGGALAALVRPVLVVPATKASVTVSGGDTLEAPAGAVWSISPGGVSVHLRSSPAVVLSSFWATDCTAHVPRSSAIARDAELLIRVRAVPYQAASAGPVAAGGQLQATFEVRAIVSQQEADAARAFMREAWSHRGSGPSGDTFSGARDAPVETAPGDPERAAGQPAAFSQADSPERPSTVVPGMHPPPAATSSSARAPSAATGSSRSKSHAAALVIPLASRLRHTAAAATAASAKAPRAAPSGLGQPADAFNATTSSDGFAALLPDDNAPAGIAPAQRAAGAALLPRSSAAFLRIRRKPPVEPPRRLKRLHLHPALKVAPACDDPARRVTGPADDPAPTPSLPAKPAVTPPQREPAPQPVIDESLQLAMSPPPGASERWTAQAPALRRSSIARLALRRRPAIDARERGPAQQKSQAEDETHRQTVPTETDACPDVDVALEAATATLEAATTPTKRLPPPSPPSQAVGTVVSHREAKEGSACTPTGPGSDRHPQQLRPSPLASASAPNPVASPPSPLAPAAPPAGQGGMGLATGGLTTNSPTSTSKDDETGAFQAASSASGKLPAPQAATEARKRCRISPRLSRTQPRAKRVRRLATQGCTEAKTASPGTLRPPVPEQGAASPDSPTGAPLTRTKDVDAAGHHGLRPASDEQIPPSGPSSPFGSVSKPEAAKAAAVGAAVPAMRPRRGAALVAAARMAALNASSATEAGPSTATPSADSSPESLTRKQGTPATTGKPAAGLQPGAGTCPPADEAASEHSSLCPSRSSGRSASPAPRMLATRSDSSSHGPSRRFAGAAGMDASVTPRLRAPCRSFGRPSFQRTQAALAADIRPRLEELKKVSTRLTSIHEDAMRRWAVATAKVARDIGSRVTATEDAREARLLATCADELKIARSSLETLKAAASRLGDGREAQARRKAAAALRQRAHVLREAAARLEANAKLRVDEAETLTSSWAAARQKRSRSAAAALEFVAMPRAAGSAAEAVRSLLGKL